MPYPLLAVLGTYVIFSAAYSFSTLFLNIFIWQHHESLVTLGWFQFCSFLSTFVGFLSGAFFIRLLGSRVTFFLASLAALCLYLFLAHGDFSMNYSTGLVGILNGLYIGLFFSGLNFYSLWFTEREHLARVISMQYIISGTAQLLTPPVVGWIIFHKGYEAAFMAAVFILALQVMASTVTPQVKIREPFRRKGFFVPSSSSMKRVGVSAASFGFFFAFVHMSLSIYVYLFVRNEWVLGEWNTLFALLSVFTYFIVGKKLLRSYYDIIAPLGVIISTVITFTLWVPSPMIFILFNAIISVSLPMLWVPAFTYQFETIRSQARRSSANSLTKTMELLVYREFTLCIGRLTFFALLMITYTWLKDDALGILVFLLCFMPSAIYWLGRQARQDSQNTPS